jgi:tRNA modification GTPase
MRHEEPIVAIASGAGAAAIGILRLTGQNCLALLEHCLVPQYGKEFQPSQMRLCHFIDHHTSEVLDEPMAVFFRGPKSYTGQDSVEIYLHGGPYIIQRCLHFLTQNGFRIADPGEFTQRAFLNGKLDLTAAEGIKELIDATSHQQWIAARQLATGKLRITIDLLRDRLVEALAYLEAQIDFPDEKETADLAIRHVTDRVDQVEIVLKKLRATYQSGRVASRGLKVALFGHPNAGKSTLMNELLGHNRAIVSAQPGTTRDYLEENCHIAGRLICLIDTAGIRAAEGEIEKLGVARSLEIAEDSDIILFLIASSATAAEKAELERWQGEFSHKQSLTVVTKSDLGLTAWTSDHLVISSTTGTGIEELKSLLSGKVDSYVKPLSEEPFITSTRHLTAIDTALNSIKKFRAALNSGAYEEMLAFELQEATKALSSIVGTVDQEDILDRIFSEFCIGK